jgi:hypothetical protein
MLMDNKGQLEAEATRQPGARCEGDPTPALPVARAVGKGPCWCGHGFAVHGADGECFAMWGDDFGLSCCSCEQFEPAKHLALARNP